MIRFFLIILMLPMCLLVQAQNQSKADSLLRIVETNKLSGDDSLQLSVFLDLALYESSPLNTLEYGLEALRLARARKDAISEAEALDLIAGAHRNMGNKTDGFTASFQALQIFDSLQLQGKKAALLLQIGSQYTADANLNEGLNYLKQSVSVFKSIHDELGVSEALLNLGETYRLSQQLDSAQICFEEVILRNEIINDPILLVYAQGNLGMVKKAQGDLTEAFPLLRQSITELGKLGDTYAVTFFQGELGKGLIEQGQVSEGLHKVLNALEMAKTERIKEQIRDLSAYLSIYYSNHRNHQKAYLFQKQYAQYQDSLVNAANIRQVEQIRYSYELDKKSREIENIRLNKELAESRLIQRRNQIIVMIIIGTLLVILLWVVFKAYQRNKRAKEQLASKNKVISEQAEQKEVLHRELHHRVKNNLQLISSLMSLQSFNTKDKEVATAMKEGKSRVEALTLIHQNLYFNENISHVNIEDYLDKLCENFGIGYHDHIKSIEHSSANVNINTDDIIPIGLIVNEAVCNSIKHRGPQLISLKIGFQPLGDNYELSITDDGPGGLEWSGSSDIRNHGFGTNLIAALADQLEANLEVQSNDQGTAIKLQLNSAIASTKLSV